MEKYGVVIDKPEEKTGSAGTHSCPDCGKKLEPNTNVQKCPVDGTKPFEKPEK